MIDSSVRQNENAKLLKKAKQSAVNHSNYDKWGLIMAKTAQECSGKYESEAN